MQNEESKSLLFSEEHKPYQNTEFSFNRFHQDMYTLEQIIEEWPGSEKLTLKAENFGNTMLFLKNLRNGLKEEVLYLFSIFSFAKIAT